MLYLDLQEDRYHQCNANFGSHEHIHVYLLLLFRDVLFEFHLKFWNTASIGIPARSLL